MSLFARFIALCLLLCASAGAQNKILIPERLERETVVDDKGMVQWAEWKPVECPNCVGKGKVKCTTCERFLEEITNCPECKRNEAREVTCRLCAGEGTLPDPLEKASCPGCRGASFLLCTTCGGAGGMRVGDDKRISPCPACRGEGSFPCGACKGARLCETAALKPSLKDAKLKDLQKAMAATDKALEELAKFEAQGGDKARKEVKALIKIWDLAGPNYPPLKRMGKSFEDYMGKIYAGRTFQGSADKEAATMKMQKDASEHYLKHQRRMLELAQKRAEANEEAAAKAKGK
jgi:hypothetical protein